MLCTYQYFQPEADKDGRTVLFDWELDEAEELQERRFVPVFRGTVSKDGLQEVELIDLNPNKPPEGTTKNSL